jgi:hypothetical protein
VSIAASTTYVVSYHTTTGGYSVNQNYFAAAGYDNAPLHGLASSTSGGNGVYLYGSGGFPTGSYQATNYWVDVVFVPGAATPPVITAVSATNVTASGATITWTTNNPANSQVEYGTTASYGTLTTLDPALVTGHSEALSGLSSSTLYHYRVHSADASGNQAVSGDFTFTTVTQRTNPPVVTNMQAVGISSGSATVTWTTDETANSQVEYGTTTAYGSATTLDPALVTSHSEALGGLAASTLYHYRVHSTDAFGNQAVTGDFTFTTTATAPVSLWATSTVPAVQSQSDTSAVELGLKFQVDTAGHVTGVRFYKGSANTGTHVANLWTSTGALLATATFSGETSSGWQQVNFGTPVAVTTNTTYIVSYHTTSGGYSVNQNYFTTAGYDNAPLHALASSTSGGNGVYLYGSGGFPTNSYLATNYWVDVVFVPGQ